MLIPLTQGKFAIVDAEDYEALSQSKWFYHGGYASRQIFDATKKSKKRQLRMHRLINRTRDGFDTDHINGDGLDNRKSNLRTATHAQNGRNQKTNKNNKLGVKGVSRRTKARGGNAYVAQIVLNYRKIYLGVFATIGEAAQAYIDAAKKYHGEFACV